MSAIVKEVYGKNKKCPSCNSSDTTYLSTKRVIKCKTCNTTFKHVRSII